MTLFARHFFTLFVTFGEMLWFTFVDKFCQIGHNLRIFVAFWWNIVIYALCRILVKCRDLRIFPGKKIRFPGTKNYYAALNARIMLVFVWFCRIFCYIGHLLRIVSCSCQFNHMATILQCGESNLRTFFKTKTLILLVFLPYFACTFAVFCSYFC